MLRGKPVRGLSWCRNDVRLILVSNAGSWTRQRFTLAHEFCHVLAGDAQDLQVDIDVMSSAARHADSEMRTSITIWFSFPDSRFTPSW